MMASRIVIRGGETRCVFDPRLLPLLERLGVSSVARATDIEPDLERGEYVATFRTTGQEIASGPLTGDRSAVIAQEVRWIERNAL